MGQVRWVRGWWLGALLALTVGAGARAQGVDEGGMPAEGRPHIVLTEAQILEVARVINQSEVDQGNLALQKGTDAQVRAFARRMVDEHTLAVVRLDALAQQMGTAPAPSPLSEKIQMHAAKALADLQGMAQGFHFDFGYMVTQGIGHAHVAHLYDGALWYQAQSPMLLDELRMERVAVQAHLQSAWALIGTLWHGQPQSPQPAPQQEPPQREPGPPDRAPGVTAPR